MSAGVKYLGVDEGRVEKMELDDSSPPKVKLTLAVFEDTPIKEDTTAQLTPQGITGIQFIELIRGQSARDLPAGSEIKFTQSKLTDIVAKIDRLSGAVDEFFGTNKEKLSRALDQTNEFLATSTHAIAALETRVEAVIDENRVSIHDLIVRARAATDDVSRMAAEVQDRHLVEDVSRTLGDARKAIQDLDAAVEDIRAQVAAARLPDTIAQVHSTARTADELLAGASGRLQDDLAEASRVLDELQRTAASVKQLSHEVGERPALLLRDLEQPRRKVVDK